MREEYKIAFGEVLEYLKYISKEEVDKINPQFMSYLKENAVNIPENDKDYSKPMYEIDFSPEAKTVLVFMAYKYWSNSEEERKELLDILNQNEEKYDAELREKYNPDNIFKNVEKTNDTNETNENKELITEEDAKKSRNIFNKFISFIKNLFKK